VISVNLKPTHQAVKAYYEELQTLRNLDFYAEGAVSPAFAALLRHCAKQGRLTLVEQYSLKKNGRTLRVDGALLDHFKLPHGYWEAKDTADDLDKEIKKKFAAGYPRDNILFQAPQRAVLYQHGQEDRRAGKRSASRLSQVPSVPMTPVRRLTGPSWPGSPTAPWPPGTP
jgi:hypothetical protein